MGKGSIENIENNENNHGLITWFDIMMLEKIWCSILAGSFECHKFKNKYTHGENC